MTTDEETRHRIHQRFEELLGARDAAAVMELLPPRRWDDVATKGDIERLEARIEVRLAGMDARFDGQNAKMDGLASRFDARLEREMRLMTWRLVATMVALASVVIAGFRL